MPLVQVVVNPPACGPEADSFCRQSNLSVFGARIRSRIAEALTCSDPGGKLSETDIEVVIRKRNDGYLEIGGEQYGLQITIFTNNYPERGVNLKYRTATTTRRIAELLPAGVKFYVWIVLAPACFMEGQS